MVYQEILPNCSGAFRLQNRTIRDNTGNLYSAWTKLGTRLGLIPLLGGIDENVLFKDQDGKTAFEKEVEYFGALLEKYPERAVIYKDKPLMVIFLGRRRIQIAPIIRLVSAPAISQGTSGDRFEVHV